MKKLYAVLAGGMFVVGFHSAVAHHSFPATYDGNAEVTIEGVVVQFMLRNPHSFVHVNVTSEDGTSQRWAIEWAAAAALGRDSVKRDTLRPGDKVVVTGNPGRNPADHRMLMRSVERPSDGWKWAGRFN